MDVDQKLKELADKFTKTGKELADLVKKNEDFIMNEVRKVEDTIQKTSEACAKGKMDRLRKIKEEYAKNIKVCNDKAAAGLKVAKAKCEQRVEGADALIKEVQTILKECMETNDYIKCVADETREAANRRKEVAQKLNGAVGNAEISVTEQMKEAAKCYATVKADALKKLQTILKETKDCVQKMK